MTETVFQTLGRFLRSPAFKLALIGFLVLLLAIPLFSVWALVSERQNRSDEVAREIGRGWGGVQSIGGPFLAVPYTVRVPANPNGGQPREQIVERYAVFLPGRLDITAKAASQVLHRSIYQAPVYTAGLGVSGRFDAPDMALVESATDIVAVRWADAVLALGITDVAGLKQASKLNVPGRGQIGFEPSVGVATSPVTGIHVRLASLKPAASTAQPAQSSAPPDAFDFDFSLTITGNSAIDFAPVARETSVALDSDWPSPSFSGGFLPVERQVGPTGFTAKWKVPHLARSVPQAWSTAGPELNLYRFEGYRFGANLYVPVDFYDLVSRAIKYGLMFPVIVFMAVFIMEALTRKRMHPVQYLFTGTALVLFFALVLGFAEHIGFGPAYALAALATSGLVAAYVWRALGSAAKGGIMLAVLPMLYGLLYLILRLEDYALLAGTLAAFVMLAAAMFLTLGIDWSGAKSEEVRA